MIAAGKYKVNAPRKTFRLLGSLYSDGRTITVPHTECANAYLSKLLEQGVLVPDLARPPAKSAPSEVVAMAPAGADEPPRDDPPGRGRNKNRHRD